MGLKLIRQATCDRCGRECSGVVEQILREEEAQKYDVRIKRLNNNVYHYTEMTLQGYDNRFECRTDKLIFCGKCNRELEEFIIEGRKRSEP